MSRTRVYLSLLAGVVLAVQGLSVPAAGQQDATGTANPLGAGSGWTTDVSPGRGTAPQDAATTPYGELSPKQRKTVQRLSDYFNSVQHLEGRFKQINPNGESVRGKFYVQRPGLLRFDYAPPSKLRVVADGRYLSIEDHDLKTVDQFPLESTPFRLLLAEQVDLLRDAQIIDFSQSKSIASVTLEDRSDGSRGRLQLFFTEPDVSLREWVVTDPQGLDTRIQLMDVVAGNQHNRDFFKSSALDFISVQD